MFARSIMFCGLLLVTANLFAAPRIAIIIDDLGHNFKVAQEVLALPVGVTISVLPQRRSSGHIAQAAQQQRREVMLHLPMQARGANRLGPGGLCIKHSAQDIKHIIRDNLASVPYVAGINNHMGSLFTSDPDAMQSVMSALQQYGDFYFIDSRTDRTTQAEQIARRNGLRTSSRNVFLDNQQDPNYIRQQLKQLLSIAQKKGSAIAIGHPHSSTLNVLREVLAEWQQQGIQLLPVSQIIAYQAEEKATKKHSSNSR